MTFTHALATNNYGPAKFIVDSSAANGTHTTIAAALTSASSGDTIFIRPGTYTENLTLKAGVNLTAFGSDSSANATGHVIISGTCTMTTAGSVTISGIQLQTNSAALLAVTGSAASIVNLEDCYLNCTNNTGITFSTSSSSAQINITNSKGDLGTTGIGLFAHSSAGTLFFYSADFSNSGGSSTASTASAGTLGLRRCAFASPITTSGTATTTAINFQSDTSAQNATCLTAGGSGGNNFYLSRFQSGTASAISISATAGLFEVDVSSTNTNAITGAGTCNYSGVSFSGSSSKNNTTTLGTLNSHFGGISFDGGTNTLSAYTVGTFTPTLVGAAVAGTTTYSTQLGYYVRVGAVVTIQASVQGSAATGTGSTSFGALPFTVKNQASGSPQGNVLHANAAGWTWPASTTSIAFSATANTTTGLVYASGSAAAAGNMQMANAAFNWNYTVTHEI